MVDENNERLKINTYFRDDGEYHKDKTTFFRPFDDASIERCMKYVRENTIATLNDIGGNMVLTPYRIGMAYIHRIYYDRVGEDGVYLKYEAARIANVLITYQIREIVEELKKLSVLNRNMLLPGILFTVADNLKCTKVVEALEKSGAFVVGTENVSFDRPRERSCHLVRYNFVVFAVNDGELVFPRIKAAELKLYTITDARNETNSELFTITARSFDDIERVSEAAGLTVVPNKLDIKPESIRIKFVLHFKTIDANKLICQIARQFHLGGYKVVMCFENDEHPIDEAERFVQDEARINRWIVNPPNYGVKDVKGNPHFAVLPMDNAPRSVSRLTIPLSCDQSETVDIVRFNVRDLFISLVNFGRKFFDIMQPAPRNAEAQNAAPQDPEAQNAEPQEPEAQNAAPQEPEAQNAAPQEPEAQNAAPQEPEAQNAEH